ncbi:MAG: NAD(P)H-dependent glycerol-3-phosphate dehydrogenase [Chloracidobacterium sp.]|uniref:Glycerol-3-phosphate dehydrogenase [NAD(P)+] n=1 Tax=Chloracidobacterium validum TaxID=2821543 RepID=A0ABX8B8N2_9BACT|nr:NAD(P)H-dependent glycerol-3-phosphate dehydrogenase [Chloracidobacterium validum]QUW02039.1 NAD(P)-dependent glycerol-3-phosphate dehydrogenase [Chloracidobacterium validum]
MEQCQRIAVIGAGSWGTALALVAAARSASNHVPRLVTLWGHRPEHIASLAAERENRLYLPGFPFPDNLRPTADLAAALDGAQMVLLVVPSHVTRATLLAMRPYVTPTMVFVSATKGIETDTLMRMSEVAFDVWHDRFEPRYVALSGPNFAYEVAKGDPTATVVAAFAPRWGEYVQGELSTPNFRLYYNQDITGVEIAGASKNVIAIAAGVMVGLGFGHNTVVTLITRGLAEITRLAVALGARVETLSGLAGVGDLFLTATGTLSRNRYVGVELGKGRQLDDILAGMTNVAEGVKTTKAIHALAQKHQVDMPMTRGMYQVLYEGRRVRDAMAEVMGRPLRREY